MKGMKHMVESVPSLGVRLVARPMLVTRGRLHLTWLLGILRGRYIAWPPPSKHEADQITSSSAATIFETPLPPT